MAKGRKLAPFDGVDVLSAQQWGGKRGYGAVKGRLSTDEAELVAAFASLPFDGSGNLLRALAPPYEYSQNLERIARIYAAHPNDFLAVVGAVTGYMKGRTAVAKAVAADAAAGLHSPASVIANRIGCSDEAIVIERKRQRKNLKDLRQAELTKTGRK